MCDPEIHMFGNNWKYILLEILTTTINYTSTENLGSIGWNGANIGLIQSATTPTRYGEIASPI